MAYLVLARKYRPRQFEEVVGQESAARTLKNAIENNRVAHAYLFAGPRGVGKTSMARILARALNCKDGPTATPCGTCELCTGIARGHVDVIEIDGASNNSVEDIRTLRQNVQYLPSQCRYKIYIIDEVHMLSPSAFNALLKTLEEPPDHVIFIFATTEPNKVLETIRSRCQRLDFKRIPTPRIVETLDKICKAEGIEIEPAALMAIARNARGGLRDSESLLDQLVSFTGSNITENDVYEALGALSRDSLFKLVDSIIDNDAPAALEILHNAVLQGIDGDVFLDELMEHLRILMLLNLCGEKSPLIDETPEDRERLQRQQQDLSIDTILYAIQVLSDTKSKIRGTADSRIPVEMALIRLAHLGKIISLDEIAQRLETLGNSADTGGRGPSSSPFRPSESAPLNNRSNAQAPPASGRRSASASGQAGAQRPAFSQDRQNSSQQASGNGAQPPASAQRRPATPAPPHAQPQKPQAGGQPQTGADAFSAIAAGVMKKSSLTGRALRGIIEQDDQSVTIGHVNSIGFDRSTVEAAAKRVLGPNVRVILQETDSPAPQNSEPGEAAADAMNIPEDDAFAEYYDDPSIKNIVQNFRGRIIEVKGKKQCPKD